MWKDILQRHDARHIRCCKALGFAFNITKRLLFIPSLKSILTKHQNEIKCRQTGAELLDCHRPMMSASEAYFVAIRTFSSDPAYVIASCSPVSSHLDVHGASPLRRCMTGLLHHFIVYLCLKPGSTSLFEEKSTGWILLSTPLILEH